LLNYKWSAKHLCYVNSFAAEGGTAGKSLLLGIR
jgi:hypothetical protein